MGVRQVTVATCDNPECGEEIRPGKEPWINVMVYGAAFHVGCWRQMGAQTVAKALGLDDIRLTHANDDHEKAIYAESLQ